MSTIKVGIIGFGLMGEQRARDIKKIKELELAVVSDVNLARLAKYQSEFGFEIESDWKKVIARKNIGLVVVAVPHYLAAEIVIAALRAGKHVLCEKPFGMDATQAALIAKAAKDAGTLVESGFNYRFYPGIQKVRELIAADSIGKITHVRIVFGHGGRRGMEKEWKMVKKFAGGGSLLDPGIHIIDLIRFLFGEPKEGVFWQKNSFWDVDVEDNAFVLLNTEHGVMVSAHVSTTEWKNLFRMEIFGKNGYIFLTGRSRSYGPQEVRMGKRWFFEDRSEEEVWSYPLEDVSFLEELKHFLQKIQGKKSSSLADMEDGIRALEIIGGLYGHRGISSPL